MISENGIEAESGSSRGSFSGKIGFILAAAGSAVGLGNIWRFPYLAAKYGGGIFLLVYILLSVSFGKLLMSAEIAIGRRTRKSPIEAFSSLNSRFGFLGKLASVGPLLILPYYSLVGGWVIKYAVGFVTGKAQEMSSGVGNFATYFDFYTTKVGEPIVYLCVFLLLTMVVVMLGVEKGIEKVSKVVMPLLVVLMLFVAVYIFATVDGVGRGLRYYLMPDFSKFGITTVVSAMGQLFYSMSIGMGVMITFGSYMKRKDGIRDCVHKIEMFDTGIAILAGLMIIPAAVAYDESQLGMGAGLIFGVLPKVFSAMAGGGFIGAVFFLMVLLAALTSSISLMEALVCSACDWLKVNRKTALMFMGAICLFLGVLSSLGYSALDGFRIFGRFRISDFFDFIANSVIMPTVAILTCAFVSYAIDTRELADELYLEKECTGRRLFSAMLRYIAPVCLTVILVFAVLEGVGIITL